MLKSSTITQAKKELKGMDLTQYILKIEVAEDEVNEFDIILNAYNYHTGRHLESIMLETYDDTELTKLEKRLSKLAETYEIVDNR